VVDRVLRLVVLLLAGSLLGCGESSVEASLTTPPPGIDLSVGKTDPRLVGVWKNPNETYTFAADGSFKMHFDRMEQTGPSASSLTRKFGDLAGNWSATNDSLLLEVLEGEKDSKHKMTLILSESGKTMELRPTFLKKGPGTVYVRTK
jgi:hypothetical protein